MPVSYLYQKVSIFAQIQLYNDLSDITQQLNLCMKFEYSPDSITFGTEEKLLPPLPHQPSVTLTSLKLPDNPVI